MPQTPTHWLVTRQLARHTFPGDRAAQAAAELGAVLPDLYYWARGTALAARHRRWDPAFVDSGRETRWPDKALHSLLPPAALTVAAACGRSRVLAAFAASWAAHVAADLPVHDGSSRPPAWPLWSWRFRSPVAADEPGHHARLLLAAETVACAAILAQHVRTAGRAGHRTGVAGWLADEAVLLRAWARHPLLVGEVFVTSQPTVRFMLDLARTGWAQVPEVIELGAGTGSYTGQILGRLGPHATLTAIERDPGLAARVKARYPGDQRLTVLCQDAGLELGRREPGTVPLMVSALPWTSMPPADRDRLLGLAASRLAPGGELLTIQYTTACDRLFRRYFGDVTHAWSLANVPPAACYRLARPVGDG
ncbi:MAG TPA: methyltransferase domain-containing protein [Streptosporangiaceae bacterium]|nr:methyltransferase domain-containing protein [Streptosporangiaceae bacterium]